MRPLPILLSVAALLLLHLSCAPAAYIMTVSGKVPAKQLGLTLPHEHITTDFTGAEKVPQPQYDRDSAVATILPYLLALKERGVQTLVECTPNYIGRDVSLLKILSERSGLQIITNTGYYSAVDKKYLPAHAYAEDAATIAGRWEREWTEGIDATGIRPGFIKLGVGSGPLDSIEAKLLRAAILVSRRTGLVIAMHTGDGAAARSEYDILQSEGLSADRMIWVHAQNATDAERIELARRGVWISLDGVNAEQIERYVGMIQALKTNGLLHRLLLSHDDGWSVENRDGNVTLAPFGNGNPLPYTTIFSRLLDALRKAGLSQTELDQVMIENPAAALRIRKE